MKIKNLILKKLLFVILTVLFIPLQFVYSQNSCYDNNSTGCGTWNVVNNVTFTDPNYPNCPLNYSYEWRVCNGNVQVYVFAINIDESNSNCSSLLTDIYPNYPDKTTIIWTKIQEIWDFAYEKAMDVSTTAYINTLSNADKDTKLCVNGGYFEVKYYRGACRAHCECPTSFNMDGFPTSWTYYEKKCNTSCCGEVRQYCFIKTWNPINNYFVYTLQLNSTNYFTDNPNCTNGNYYEQNCYEGRCSDCVNICHE